MLKNLSLMALSLVLVTGLVLPTTLIADTTLTVTITSPATGANLNVGQEIAFAASVSGGNGDYSYLWNFGDGTQAGGRTTDKTYNATGSRTVTLVVTDTDAKQGSANITLNIVNPTSPLSATIVRPANNAQLIVGQSTLFEVVTTGGNGDFSYLWNFGDGTQAGGRTTDKTYHTTGARTVTVVVTDTDSHQASAQINVSVVSAPNPAPTVDLKVNNSDGPITLTAGTGATLAWSSQNTTACTASGAWSGARSTGSSEATGNLSVGSYTYTLTCTGPGGSATDAVTVNVQTTPNPTVSADLQGSVSGTSVTLTWTSANVTSCTASNAWTGTKATSGSETLNNVAVGTHTYTLTCTGANGTATDSATVTVSSTTDPLVISNVRVTDITQTTAIVRWTTNRAANSRVIYDTVSHPNISGASEPNFGYAYSTATFDENSLVTEHAVTLTGLSANTQYYFRVLSR